MNVLPQTIRGKLAAAFAVIVVTTVIAGFVLQSSYEVIDEKIAIITDESVPSVVAAQRVAAITGQIAASAPALHGADSEVALIVLLEDLDAQLIQLETEVDKLAVRIIALRAPMADDLREVIAALKIGGVVERIGDYSKNIAKRVGRIDGRDRFEPLTLLPAMGELASEMVHDVLTSYAARDPELALEVIAADSKVDAFYNSIFRNVVSYMVENPATISSAAQLLFVARNIERIGDHATNVAEMVHFAATGTYPPDSDE